MNPDELLEILREANAAVRLGASPQTVGERISEVTNGQYDSLPELGRAVDQAERKRPESAQQRLAADGSSATEDFLRMAAQGATFGFGDELAGAGAALVPGGKDYKGARDESRQRVEDLRELASGASTVSEIAGGVAVPFLTGAKVARSLTSPSMGALGRAGAGTAGGITGGGGGSALYAAGETEGGPRERAKAAVPALGLGAIVGGPLGGALPLVGAGLGKTGRFAGEVVTPQKQGRREARRRLRQVFDEAGVAPDEVRPRMQELGPDAVIADLDPRLAREARNARNQASALERTGGPVQRNYERTAQRGERMAKAMREASGISETMESGKELAERAIQEVRRTHYRPLEEAFPEVQGPNVQQALQDPRVARVAKRVAPDAMADDAAVARAVAQGVPEEQARQAIPDRAPSFMELQDIRLDLQDDMTEAMRAGRPNASRRAQKAFDMLNQAMAEDVPGFAEAQNAYRNAAQTLEAFDIGASMQTKTARQMREALEELPPEAHDAFRVGLLQRWEEKLLKREGTAGTVNSILKAGPEMKEQIRAVFGSEEGFEQFLRTRDLERTFRITESAVQGNSTTAQQALDAIDSVPTSKSELLNKVWDALFSPGEARRVQAEAVGERLLGSDVDEVVQTLRPNPLGVGVPGAGGGTGAASGVAAMQLFGGPGTLLERLSRFNQADGRTGRTGNR